MGDSAADVELVRGIYTAMARQDFTALERVLDPDVTVRQSDRLPWGGVFHGVEGFRAFLAAVAGRLNSRVEVDAIYDCGDHVVQVGRTWGTTTEGGREFRVREVHVWTVRSGRVTELEILGETGALLAALTPPD